MTTIDGTTAQRLAALERRRSASTTGKRRRPAEASRMIAAGAGTAAVLTMVASMAQADQAVEVTEMPVVETQTATLPQAFGATVPEPSSVTQTAPAQVPVVQTITVTRPVRAQSTNARTSASR